jgi:hypothetical protein
MPRSDCPPSAATLVGSLDDIISTQEHRATCLFYPGSLLFSFEASRLGVFKLGIAIIKISNGAGSSSKLDHFDGNFWPFPGSSPNLFSMPTDVY